jgi:hypothetical protein
VEVQLLEEPQKPDGTAEGEALHASPVPSQPRCAMVKLEVGLAKEEQEAVPEKQ